MKTKHLSLLIKPASSLCNLRCKYCFYHDVSDNRDIKSHGIMTKEIVDILIENVVNSTEKSINFAFQGGEPTLAGLDYFDYFTKQVKKKISDKKIQVNYSIQTNGVNITKEFVEFFKKNNFLVGLSLDGIKDINDFFRVDASGEGTHGKILKISKLFDKYTVDYNILTVITSQTAKHIEKIYNYYKNQGFTYLQFIPCLAPLGQTPFTENYSLTPELYEKFLINLFRLWYNDLMNDKYISIRFFDNLTRIAAGYPSEQCGTLGFCDGYFVIESDGSVYPCDFYCVDDWKIGNIKDMSFEELIESPNMLKFRETSFYSNYSDAERKKCESCEVFYLCKGGCRRDRDNQTEGHAGENIYCGALRNFYLYAEPYLQNIIKKINL